MKIREKLQFTIRVENCIRWELTYIANHSRARDSVPPITFSSTWFHRRMRNTQPRPPNWKSWSLFQIIMASGLPHQLWCIERVVFQFRLRLLYFLLFVVSCVFRCLPPISVALAIVFWWLWQWWWWWWRWWWWCRWEGVMRWEVRQVIMGREMP